MKREMVIIGIVIMGLGAIFIPISRISETKQYWTLGDGSVHTNAVEREIFFENGDRWTVLDIFYAIWVDAIAEYAEQSPDNIWVSLNDDEDNEVERILYKDLQKLPHGILVPDFGRYTIKIEQPDGDARVLEATFRRNVYVEEIVFPYSGFFQLGLLLTLVGAAISIVGAATPSK